MHSLSCCFGLSYASWYIFSRVLMGQMPDDWQERMVKLIEEYNETYPNLPDLDLWIQARENGKFVKVPSWLENYRHPEQEQIDKVRGQT